METMTITKSKDVGKMVTGIKQSHVRPAADDDFLFQIESGIPVPKGGKPSSSVTREALNKMTYIFNNLKPGQSFVFGNLSVGTVRKHMRNTFPHMKTRMKLINREKGWYRIWLLP